MRTRILSNLLSEAAWPGRWKGPGVFVCLIGIAVFCVCGGAVAPGVQGQALTRARFTPPVVPETQTDPVRFEATVSGNPSSVAFNYNGADRPMFDNGSNGDLVAGDGIWTILFTPAEILSKNTPARVFRPFIGTCRPAGGGAFNVVAEVWTSTVGLPAVRPIDGGGQETDYIVNYVATGSQLLSFDQKIWAQRFYATHGDKFDFLNFVLVAGPIGNRFHFATRNTVQGIGLGIFDNTSQYGSAGKLQGINTFPISTFFDGGDAGFAHETGHQWINFLSGTPFAAGVPHWPRGNIASNVMGFSIGGPGGQGGNYPFTFSPNGSGGYVVGNGNPLDLTTFNSMELYLMGLIPPSDVGAFFVLNDQNQNVSVGQTLQPSEITTVTINDVISARGARLPDSTQSQKNFRSATVVLSEQLLDAHAMALYDYFARRSEEKQQLAFASGLATGTCNPWYLATGGRSLMVSAIADPIQTVQFSAAGFSVNEGDGTASVTVTRTGDTSGASSVDYRTTDTDNFTVNCAAKNAAAFARCDFATVVGTINFAAGEISKTIIVPIINDSYAEGNETFNLVLSNAVRATLGSFSTATVTINDNETSDGTNPILQTNAAGVAFFVRQHYLDFLGREPEPGEPWTAILNRCSDQFNTNPASPAVDCDRIFVSGSFFGSPEFKDKGFYIIGMYRVAFNRLPTYLEFSTDLASITGTTAPEVFAKRAAYASSFVQRTEFTNIYGAMSSTTLVNTLMSGGQGQNYNLTSITTKDPANPDTGALVTLTTTDLINQLTAATLTRGNVLRAIAQSNQIALNKEAVNAFVASQYYGYLRRTPDTGGFNSWVTYLGNNPTDFRTMINGFANSSEYRSRFGP